ncbi:uncharacterized protein LOC125802274 [Astyanax mexicanus]|uniref:uncharacterized protein LOC125802274 n=1 Tax=Astyanax mexicanus TaxID=7994 RepID=UPI0020CAD2EC|nr:uncharacterized protein LOC125802274 [Astyanax mexicanus]
MKDGENKALGVGYLVEEDKLYLMTSINFSKRKKKMRLGRDLHEGEVRENTPNPLTRRELLSQVAGLYDPIGLVTPAKQKGAVLVRKAFQEVGSRNLTRDTWDNPLSEGLREDAVKLFVEYVQLGQITFQRSLTPAGWKGKPWGVTFSDGSESAYGAVAYLRWQTDQGIEVRLIESKAKLTPLNQKGEAVKAEICGAVFATRLRKYIERHSRMEVERWLHLVDSRTVLGAIQRDSYGYQTFFANRIGEIQKDSSISDWWWIPGDFNIADIITRGSSPEDLNEHSVWQRGPEFLRRPEEEWPKKSAKEVAVDAREDISKLQRKSFSAAITRSQANKPPENIARQGNSLEEYNQSSSTERTVRGRAPAPSMVKTLIDVTRFSNLHRLVSTVAWVWQAAKKWLKLKNQSGEKAKWEVTLQKKATKNLTKELVLNVREREDAFRDLVLSAQENATFSVTTLNRLVVYREESSGLLLCGGRVQNFSEDRTAVPVLPHNAWISTLLCLESHKTNHEGVAGTLLKMRKKAWVIKGRRLAKRIVDSCIICRKARARKCRQIMGDLPPERSTPSTPFEFTTLDLFGPYEVRDEVKKRVKLKVWGIVWCCMASRAIHADVVSDQSSEGFLLAYKRFTALRGHPRKLWSDPGTNFTGAKPALGELYCYLDQLNKTELEREAAKNGTEWHWHIHPADSPHRNGAAEAAVQIIKRALQNLGGDGSLTWGEFQTFLYMAANLANERPIDARIQSREDSVEYISPNSLLLGRTGPRGDPGDFSFQGYPYKRLKAIQEEVNRFWKKWCQLAGPNLFVRNKWHTKERNVAVGDLVWLADQNALRGQYKLARVVSVNADSKGIVRDVKVRTVPSYPVSMAKPAKKGFANKGDKATRQPSTKIPATILHRDVRRLIVLLAAEEQEMGMLESACLMNE